MEESKKEEILSLIEKASSDEYQTSWTEKGIPVSKNKEKIAEGKKSRKKGGDFELKVRKDLESKGWVVSKWQNNVDLDLKKIIPAKRKFNPFSKVMALGTGFPDFLAFQLVGEKMYNLVGVECKVNGLLSKEEKEKCCFMLEKKVFSDIWIAKNAENTRLIEYISFNEIYLSKVSKRLNILNNSNTL